MAKYTIELRDADGRRIPLRDGDVIDFTIDGRTPKEAAAEWYKRMRVLDPTTDADPVHLDPDFLPGDAYNRIQARVKSATRQLPVEDMIGSGVGDFTPAVCLALALKELARIPVKHPAEDHKMYLTRTGYYLALVAPRLAEATYRDHQDRILKTAAHKHADADGQLLTLTAHLATLVPKAYAKPPDFTGKISQNIADAGYCLTWLCMIPIWDPTSAVSHAELKANPAPASTYGATIGATYDLDLDWDASAILGVKAVDPGGPWDFKGRI